MTHERQPPFQRNAAMESLLRDLNDLLAPVEDRVASFYEKPQFPMLLVIGAPRSGTTLVTQWLAATGRFAVPTNLLSRFYRAPHIGAKIQLLLTDKRYRFRDELLDLDRSEPAFTSDLGKTRGSLAPNEFWYFWRRFIPGNDLRQLTPEEEAHIDVAGLRSELAAIEAVFGRPLAMKGMILQYNLPAARRILPPVVWVHVVRNAVANATSLLRARERYYGARDFWYSVRPNEYTWLRDLDPIWQVSGQVHFTNCAIQRAAASFPQEEMLRIDYEAFCANPGATWRSIVGSFRVLGHQLSEEYEGPTHFEVRVSEDSEEEAKRIRAALNGLALGGAPHVSV
jgi:LPS sulfotransferase NodH